MSTVSASPVPVSLPLAELSSRNRAATRLYLLTSVLLVVAAAALFVDVPLARLCREHKQHGRRNSLDVVTDLAEVFAHGYGVAMIALLVFVLDPDSRRRLPRLLACSYGAGLTSNLCKLLVARARPSAFDLNQDVWHTWLAWLPMLHREELAGLSRHGMQSFPSSHTATAAGLAIGLGWLYPRGRWLFAIFAVLAALQRIESGAHFLSDTFAGAALACLVAGACLDGRLLGLFDRIEAR